MGRIRTIKPAFARHEKLQELEAEWGQLRPMLTFCCLWTQCDREGRFEWRPRQLKLDILPFLDVDLNATLDLLRQHDFIRQYEVDGKLYGYVPTWEAHQCPNVKEAKSRLPAPPGQSEPLCGAELSSPVFSDSASPYPSGLPESGEAARRTAMPGTVPDHVTAMPGTVQDRVTAMAGTVRAHGEVEREVEKNKGKETALNAEEAAQSIAVERGWSGLRVIEQIRLALVALRTQYPERSLEEIAGWLLRRTHDYDRCAKVKAGFRMSWEKFFGEAHYNDAPESWECTSHAREPAARGVMATGHTEDATPLIRERQKKLDDFLASRKLKAGTVQ